MGLATIDPHNQKEHTEIHKILKFGVYQEIFYWDTEIWKLQNLQRNVWPSGRFVGQRSNGHTFLCKFWHFQMAVSFLLLGLFSPNMGIL